MKIEEAGVETFALGQKEVSVAKIQASAKAFEILSSSLYSNNVLAIIRELSANAKDSHKAAGCPEKPFDIQLPNKLDPSFKVRDYGIGMDHQFVMTRLNNYFDSTKNDSNEEIGGFGLGIKSGFSYTSSYMIVTFDGTHRRVYAFQIGSQGVPEISFLAETECDEPRGVELSIPVMDKDYDRFRDEAIEALTFYDPKPNITGVDKSAFDIKPLFEGTGWKIFKNPGRLKNENYVEMGNVIYPVIEDADQHNERWAYARHRRGHADMIMVYSAGIGDIDITPNREQIKLTDRSKARIAQFEETVTNELMATVQGWLDKETGSLWDVLKGPTVRRIHEQSYFFESRKVDIKKLTYKGFKIMNSDFRYTEKNPGAKLIKKVHILQENYNDVRMQEHRMDHYGIQVSARQSESIGVVIGAPGWTAKLTATGARQLMKQTKKIVYLIDVKAENVAEVIKGITDTIPDFADSIYNWDDFKAGIKPAAEVNHFFSYDLNDKNDRYYNEGQKKDFDISLFDKTKTLYYGTFKPAANNLRAGYYHDRESTKPQEIFRSCNDETFDELLTKLDGETTIYAFMDKQVKALTAAGFVLVDFVTKLDELLHEIAVEFAENRPTMTLEQYLKPLRDKNPEISISTFYKAVKRWARECNMEEEYQLLLLLNDPSSSSYRASANDHLFRQIKKMSIKDYVAKKGLKPKKETSNQFAVDLVEKAPLLSYLITRYSVQDVIDYVKKEVAGIEKPKPAAAPAAKPKARSKKVATPVVIDIETTPAPVMVMKIDPLTLAAEPTEEK